MRCATMTRRDFGMCFEVVSAPLHVLVHDLPRFSYTPHLWSKTSADGKHTSRVKN